jgi:hypothetical protein
MGKSGRPAVVPPPSPAKPGLAGTAPSAEISRYCNFFPIDREHPARRAIVSPLTRRRAMPVFLLGAVHAVFVIVWAGYYLGHLH